MNREPQRGFTLVEVLVALSVLAVVVAAFLTFVSAYMAGTIRARQLHAAVTCAQDVVESVRAGLVEVSGELTTGRCDASGFPRMIYKLTPYKGIGEGEGTEEEGASSALSGWAGVHVTVFADEGAPRPLYSLTTARALVGSSP